MANKLRTFNFDTPSSITPVSEKVAYPWDEWLDGDIWQLEQGADFETHPLMMERIIRTRATARGAKVRLRHQPRDLNGRSRKPDPFGTIVMQRTDIVGPAEERENTADRHRKRTAAAEKRASKKAAAAKDAEETLAKAGIKPKKITKASKKITKPSKRPAKRLASV